jgi:hypothetical protein
MFLKKLDIVSNVNEITAELDKILNINPWAESNHCSKYIYE